MDSKKAAKSSTAKNAAAKGGAAKKPAKQTKKTADSAGPSKQASNAGGDKNSNTKPKKAAPSKKAAAPKKKEEEFKLWTLEEIEERFAKKEEIFNERMKQFFMQKQVPLTLQLICKHAFVQKPKATQAEIEEAKVAEDQSERTESTDVTKAESEVPKFDGPPEEEAKSDSEEEDSGLEDNEAIILQQAKNIEQTLRESQSNFLKKVSDNDGMVIKGSKPILPTINRRLGGGLAAIVKQKVLARHQAKKALEE